MTGIPGFGITGVGDHYIAPERRCEKCGELLGLNDISPCERCARPVVKKQRGATKAQLAYRAKMLGTCPDCGMSRKVCATVGGCQPEPVSRGQMLTSVLKMAQR